MLVSNASMDLFPDNKLSDFKVRLPQPMVLDTNYCVAITRISFTKSYFNYEGGSATVILSESGADFVSPAAEAQTNQLIAKLIPGYYTPEEIVNMINFQIEREIRIEANGQDMIYDYPEYELSNGFLTLKHGKLRVGVTKLHWKMRFDKATEKILGLEDEENPRPVFTNQGYTDLYLYSDLVYPSVVGDQFCELLAIIDGQTEMPYGSHCC